jgi:phytoene dehydrogenase-like protein
MSKTSPEAVVVGSGPNGLSAAVTLAAAGRRVRVLEASDRIGGGTRTDELTLPGFRHDLCAAVFPLAAGSPYLSGLPLEEHGLRWIHPDAPLAHALAPDHAVIVERDLDATADRLGPDASRYRRIVGRLAADWPSVSDHLLGPPVRIPRHPFALARFGLAGFPPASVAARSFRTDDARALLAGCAAHAYLPLERPLTAAFGWLLLVGAHVHGWPVAAGGAQAIADALAGLLRSLGGEIETGHAVTDLSELGGVPLVVLDVDPAGLVRMAGDRLPSRYRRRAVRFRRGPAAFKIDYALRGPVPWRSPELRRAGTVHIGGTLEHIARSERNAWRGIPDPEPFLLVSQPSLFDPGRAPDGSHTLWVYAHVPHGSTVDFADSIEQRLEAYAPGFSDLVLGHHVTDPAGFERRNPNLVGGDITGGAHTLRQVLFRPFPQWDPYATPIDGVYLCSASTPPGGGVHGMCGHHAARAALR